MVKKTQAQTPLKGADKSPEEIAQAFMQLWQEKWNETLKQKGWPEAAPMPGIGQMPFFNPFMPMNGFTAPTGASADAETIKKLEARVAALEKKSAAAKAAPQKPAKKASKKAAAKRK